MGELRFDLSESEHVQNWLNDGVCSLKLDCSPSILLSKVLSIERILSILIIKYPDLLNQSVLPTLKQSERVKSTFQRG